MSRSAITFEILHAHFFFLLYTIFFSKTPRYIHNFKSKQCTCLIDLISRRRVTASKFDESMIKFEISIFYIPFESNWFRSFFLFLCVYWNVYIALFDTRLFLAIQINYNIQRKKKKCKIVRCKKCENMKIETLVGRTKSN